MYVMYECMNVCIYNIYKEYILSLLVTSRHGPRRKHRSSVAAQLLLWKHACLWGRYLATAVVQLFRGRSLATGLNTTIWKRTEGEKV
jgi:hypothetical protein